MSDLDAMIPSSPPPFPSSSSFPSSFRSLSSPPPSIHTPDPFASAPNPNIDPDEAAAAAARLIAKYTDRPCKGCGKAKVRGKYVNCRDCRARNREREEAKRARRREREGERGDVLQNAEHNIPVPNPNAVGGEADAGSSPPPFVKKAKTTKGRKGGSVQLRPSKLLKDMVGEEREVAMRMMKAHVARLVRRRGEDGYVRPEPKQDLGTEYLTAPSLYAALKHTLAASPVKPTFRGFHVVVAGEEGGHKEKVEAVAGELGSVGVKFDPTNPTLKQRTRNETMRNATYECTCMGYVAAPSLPASSSLKTTSTSSSFSSSTPTSTPTSSSSFSSTPTSKSTSGSAPVPQSTPSGSSATYKAGSGNTPKPPAKKPKLSSSGGNLVAYMREMQRVKALEQQEAAQREGEERERALANLRFRGGNRGSGGAGGVKGSGQGGERRGRDGGEEMGEGKKRVECGGKVKVQVQEDRSHPCGVVGQRVWVVVEH